MQAMKRASVWLILLVAFLGLTDSTYLAKEAFLGDPLLCDVAGLTGCNLVAQSPYSKLFGVPLADFGVGFYTLLFILAAVEVRYARIFLRRLIQVVSALGLITSAYFMFVQFSIIDALCVYCMISGGLSFCIFVLAYFVEPLRPRAQAVTQDREHKREALVLPPPIT